MVKKFKTFNLAAIYDNYILSFIQFFMKRLYIIKIQDHKN